VPLRLLADLLERWLTCWPPSPLPVPLPLLLPVPVPSLSRGFPTTADTMGTVFQPVGGHSPAADRKLGKVPHEEKTSIVYVFFAVAVQYKHPEKQVQLNQAHLFPAR
jgi:hypothetical protein